MTVHRADPAEAALPRGTKKRAKTDRLDAKRLRQLLQKGDLPESWIPPTFVLEIREMPAPYGSDRPEGRGAINKRRHQGALYVFGLTRPRPRGPSAVIGRSPVAVQTRANRRRRAVGHPRRRRCLDRSGRGWAAQPYRQYRLIGAR